jgi:hypothetical protein
MSVNGLSTCFGIESWKILGRYGNMNIEFSNWLTFESKMVVKILLLCGKYECQWCVDNLMPCILDIQGCVR